MVCGHPFLAPRRFDGWTWTLDSTRSKDGAVRMVVCGREVGGSRPSLGHGRLERPHPVSSRVVFAHHLPDAPSNHPADPHRTWGVPQAAHPRKDPGRAVDKYLPGPRRPVAASAPPSPSPSPRQVGFCLVSALADSLTSKPPTPRLNHTSFYLVFRKCLGCLDASMREANFHPVFPGQP